jgi:26S proteasome regulatory subunit T1
MVITAKKLEEESKEKEITPLDIDDINLIKAYGRGPYETKIKNVEDDLKKITKSINTKSGVKESDTGLAPPSMWDLAADKQTLSTEAPLQV